MNHQTRNWREILLPRYEIRKTKAQKTAFIELLRGIYGEQLRVEEEKNGVKSRNLILGDPERAKVIVTAHYDTCAVLPFPNFITPKNFPLYLLYQLLLTAVLMLPVLLAERLAAVVTERLGASDFVRFLTIEIVLLGMLALILWLVLAGPANRHTANDNTSGVIAALTMVDELSPKIVSGEWAFVLFDHEELGLLGSSAFAGSHPNVKKNGLIVNFDCVSDGDTFLIVFPKAEKDGAARAILERSAGEILGKYGKTAEFCTVRSAFYPSDQKAFRHGIAAAALKRSKLAGLYMDRIHTPRDTVFEEDNIAALTELFKTLDEM